MILFLSWTTGGCYSCRHGIAVVSCDDIYGAFGGHNWLGGSAASFSLTLLMFKIYSQGAAINASNTHTNTHTHTHSYLQFSCCRTATRTPPYGERAKLAFTVFVCSTAVDSQTSSAAEPYTAHIEHCAVPCWLTYWLPPFAHTLNYAFSVTLSSETPVALLQQLN